MTNAPLNRSQPQEAYADVPQVSARRMTDISDNERYRLLVDSIVDYAIYMLDTGGIVTSWNAGARQSLGYEADEIIGEHFSRFYTEEDKRLGLSATALATATTEGRFEQEGWRVRKDGTRFWCHVVIDPIKDIDGVLLGFAKITRDLTDRQRSRATLRRSEEQFRRLVQGVTDYAIYMLDPEGHVISWNAGAQRIKLYTEKEILGRHFSTFYTAEDRAAGTPYEGLKTAAATGRWEKEGWRVRKDGTRFLAHVIIDAIHDDSGSLVGFAKITRDVTERKRQQDALDHARSTLLQAQKLESIGRLTGGVAHDFNNLLTAILNSLELLRKWIPDNPRAKSLLENAVHGAERGATLTSHMLAFARRQELRIRSVDLHELFVGLKGMIQHSIGPTYQLVMNLPASIPPAKTDAGQLENSLLNLVLNARDAMPAGGTIAVTADSQSIPADNPLGLAEGRYIAISASDTGIGMDSETLNRAVEPFYTTKGLGKGTGLGLSMVQGLAEQSGGMLHINSTVGAGTTVTIWLPVSNLGEDDPAIMDAVEEEEFVDPGMLRILVVDDDALVRMSACALLEDLGYCVVEADNGMLALDLVAGDPSIRIVLTDHLMPGMTGLELAQALRTLNPTLPIVLATGYAELAKVLPERVARLAKPFRVAELQDAIKAALGMQRKRLRT